MDILENLNNMHTPNNSFLYLDPPPQRRSLWDVAVDVIRVGLSEPNMEWKLDEVLIHKQHESKEGWQEERRKSQIMVLARSLKPRIWISI